MLAILSKILESEVQTDLLTYMLFSVPRAYAAGELVTIIGRPKPQIISALKSLAYHQLLLTSNKEEELFYQVNSNSGLIKNIKTELQKTNNVLSSTIDPLLAGIKTTGSYKQIVLSGIFVMQPNLPVDILLVGKHNNKLGDFITKYSELVNTEINYTVMSQQEFQDRKDTFDRFIKDIFDYPNISLAI